MEQNNVQVALGMRVEASDGYLGTLEDTILSADGQQVAYLVVRDQNGRNRLVPAERIVTVQQNVVRVSLSSADITARAGSLSAESLLNLERGGSLLVPVVEERLVVGKREVSGGEVRIIKRVDTTTEQQTINVLREDIRVERVQINQPLTAGQIPQNRTEDGVLIVPILREVLVVQKQLMLVEEVHISKRQVQAEETISETLRHERVEIEDLTQTGMRGLNTQIEANNLQTGTRGSTEQSRSNDLSAFSTY